MNSCAIFSYISTPFAMIQVNANQITIIFIPKESKAQKSDRCILLPSGKKELNTPAALELVMRCHLGPRTRKNEI